MCSIIGKIVRACLVFEIITRPLLTSCQSLRLRIEVLYLYLQTPGVRGRSSGSGKIDGLGLNVVRILAISKCVEFWGKPLKLL